MAEYVHAVAPIDIPSRWADVKHRLSSRCGATGPTALVAAAATCPECLALANVTTIRTGVERAQNCVGSAVMDLCVWEGRGDWATLPADDRREAGARGLKHLSEAIAALEAQRARLRAALSVHGADDGQAEDTERSPGHVVDAVALGLPPTDISVVHYTTSSKANAECGAGWGAGYGDGTVSLWPDDVTCPQCRTRLAT